MGVQSPTSKIKKVMIQEAVELLLGKEKEPLSRRGARPKTPDVSPKIVSHINYLLQRFLGAPSQEIEWQAGEAYGWAEDLTRETVEIGQYTIRLLDKKEDKGEDRSEDILSGLTDAQKQDLKAALRFLKSLTASK